MRPRSRVTAATRVSVATKPFSTGWSGPGVNVMPCSTHSSKPVACGFGPTRSRPLLRVAADDRVRMRDSDTIGPRQLVASMVPLSPRTEVSPRTERAETQYAESWRRSSPVWASARVEERLHGEHDARGFGVARLIEQLEEHAVGELGITSWPRRNSCQ